MNKTRRRRRIRKVRDDIYVHQFPAHVQANKLVNGGSTVAYPCWRLLLDLWKEVVPAGHRLSSAYLSLTYCSWKFEVYWSVTTLWGKHRPQEVGGQHQQSTHVQMVSNVVANSMVPTPCMLPRFPPVQLEELTVDVNTTPSAGTSQQGTPEKRVCKRPAMFSQGRASGESSRKSNKRQRNSANSNDQKVSVPSNSRFSIFLL
ncbi:hypothetical protein M0R45_001350 [Rubus argutus]|uniref:Uncharacterized protein n=1 Tax=Rubus argutus TaxID=59490 RepID=A0AAW1VI16_RUBAR